jgi:hypothetical protein
VIFAASPQAAAAAAPFWSAMLTVVPVLALAMAVEVNRQLRNTESLSWGVRAFQSALLTAYAVALLVSFYMTVDALVHRDGLERATLVGALTSGSLLFLVGLPVFDVLRRVNPEVLEVLARSFPWSRWRRQRRQLKAALKEVLDTNAEITNNLEERRALLADMSSVLAEYEKAQTSYLQASALNESLPDNAIVDEKWEEVQRAAEEGELNLLRPGSQVGRFEFKHQELTRRLNDLMILKRRSDFLVRRVELRIKGSKVFRFDARDKGSFRDQIRSVATEWEHQRPS